MYIYTYIYINIYNKYRNSKMSTFKQEASINLYISSFFNFKLQDVFSLNLNFKNLSLYVLLNVMLKKESGFCEQEIQNLSARIYTKFTLFHSAQITYEYTFHIHNFFHIIFSLFPQFPSTVVFRLLVTQADNLFVGVITFEYFRLEKFTHEAQKYYF